MANSNKTQDNFKYFAEDCSLRHGFSEYVKIKGSELLRVQKCICIKLQNGSVFPKWVANRTNNYNNPATTQEYWQNPETYIQTHTPRIQGSNLEHELRNVKTVKWKAEKHFVSALH